MAATTCGWPWPSALTATPEVKSAASPGGTDIHCIAGHFTVNIPARGIARSETGVNALTACGETGVNALTACSETGVNALTARRETGVNTLVARPVNKATR